ncbi:MAG TPA: hypothetical protein VHA57_02915 [Actinomycetota bacterium]|nr:hypothetical protein [Actinomycetota bacterium]
MGEGYVDAGDDLERLLRDLASKGWPNEKIGAARDSWEEVCHDPMRRGRGGKGLPENETVSPPEPVPLSPIKPDPGQLLERTVAWPGGAPQPGGARDTATN